MLERRVGTVFVPTAFVNIASAWAQKALPTLRKTRKKKLSFAIFSSFSAKMPLSFESPFRAGLAY